MDEPDKLVSVVKAGEPIYILGVPTVEYDEGGFFDPNRRGAMDEAPFTIDGPDGDGFVWVHSTKFGEMSLNLGTVGQAAEILSGWLGSIDYEERTF